MESKWQADVKAMRKAGLTDADIQEYIDLHFTELNSDEVWEYVRKLDTPILSMETKIREQILKVAKEKGISFKEELEIIKNDANEEKINDYASSETDYDYW